MAETLEYKINLQGLFFSVLFVFFSIIRFVIAAIENDPVERKLFITLGCIWLVVALIVFFTAMWGPMLAPHNPVETDVSLRLAPPSLHYLMGNDALGRCLLSRILCGARISILLGVTIVGFSCIEYTLLICRSS